MPLLQVNPPGLKPQDPGYISSVTIRTNNRAQVCIPDPNTGQIDVDSPALTQLVQPPQKFKLVLG